VKSEANGNGTNGKGHFGGMPEPAAADPHSLIPAEVITFLSAKEKDGIEVKLTFMTQQTSPPHADEFFRNNPGFLPLKIADLLLPSERELLIKGMLEAWAEYQWHLLVDPKATEAPKKTEEVTLCCWAESNKQPPSRKTLKDDGDDAEGSPNAKRPKLGAERPHLVRMPLSVSRNILPGDEAKRYLLEATITKIQQSRRLKRYDKEVKEYGEKYLPKVLIDAVNPKSMWQVMGKIRRLIKGQEIEGKFDTLETDPEFFAAHERIIPKDIIDFFEPATAKLAIEAALELENLNTKPFDEEKTKTLEENTEWIPREVVALCTREEVLKMVENVKADQAEMKLKWDIPLDEFQAKCALKAGMKVRITEKCRKKEMPGLEGVLIEVRPKTSLVKLDVKGITTMIHTEDLEALDGIVPEVKEEVKQEVMVQE